MERTFVGFGFGPIQSALFLFEAYRSGNFKRFAVAEVDQGMVDAVRENNGAYTINIARQDGIDQFTLEGVELYIPSVSEDRQALVKAIAESQEMATALPAVRFYDMGKENSVVGLIAEGLEARSKPIPTIIYAAENHNEAAEILLGRLGQHASAESLKGVETLNTVIGKMSGVISDLDTIREMGLATVTPELGRAILVEEFNRILVSNVRMPGFERGIQVFAGKDNLLPFEEAKLYGHNAIHATIAYLADLRDLHTIADAAAHRDIMSIAREAFLKESGATLIRRHEDLNDPLFTPDGYREFADDLLERMVNPNLNDLVERVRRDPVRKLGYQDRLYGTMRLALEYGVEPRCLALGGAAALLSMIRRQQGEDYASKYPVPAETSALNRETVSSLLRAIWGETADTRADDLIRLTVDGLHRLRGDGWL